MSYTLPAAVPETDWSILAGKHGYAFILTDFRKFCFDVSSMMPICTNYYFETHVKIDV